MGSCIQYFEEMIGLKLELGGWGLFVDNVKRVDEVVKEDRE